MEISDGIHFADIDKLVALLGRPVDGSNTLIVIQHNLDVIKCADWLIDLGPEGGDRGATSTPPARPSR